MPQKLRRDLKKVTSLKNKLLVASLKFLMVTDLAARLVNKYA